MTKTKVFALVVGVLLTWPRVAATQTHETMPTPVQPDRVLIGPEFTPRRLDLPNAKQILAGAPVFEPAADSTFSYFENAGTVKFSRTRDTVLRVTTFANLPGGGWIDVGTKADPMPCDRKVEIILRDVPIDTTKDPFQWGNGLINFGRQDRVGCFKTPYSRISDVQAGATTIHVDAPLMGWRVGDELLLPDTKQPSPTVEPRREAKVTITAINGLDYTLSKPLDFEHLSVKAPDGRVALRPIVTNLTRNIVVRSENPNGTPGHTANIGDGASWDITANRIEGLGRTTTAPIDSTSRDATHIGTQQIARYNDHDHHAGHGKLGSQSVDNVYIGDGSKAKWGHVTHGTHDTLVQDNVCVGFKGACFVTEDGYEVRNKFIRNLGFYVLHQPGTSTSATENVTNGQPGAEGTVFWFRSVMNEFRDNQAWNSFDGVNFFAQQQNPGSYPSTPGGPLDKTPNAADLRHQESVAISGNVAAANMMHGFDTWGVVTPMENPIAVNNGGISVEVSQSAADQVPVYKNPLFVAQWDGPDGLEHARYPIAFEVNTGYVESLEVIGGYVGGHSIAIPKGGAIRYVRLTDVVMQNGVDLDLVPGLTREYTETNVIHKPIGSHPPHYVDFPPAVWNGTGTPPPGYEAWRQPQLGNRFTSKNWQGTGQDVRLFMNQQRATAPAWPSADDDVGMFNCHDAGITMLDCFTRYGTAFRADTVPIAQELPLVGIINGFGAVGLKTAFGPPRCVVTSPTPRAPAKVAAPVSDANAGSTLIYAELTGDPTTASDLCRVSVDGSTPFDLVQSEYQQSGHRRFSTTAVANGAHTIQLWRTTAAKATIPASLMTFTYCVGTGPCVPTLPPPTCAPPKVIIGGECVDPPPVDVCPNIAGIQPTIPIGMQLVGGQCVPIPPPPVDLCPNIPGVQTTIPAGMVLMNGQCVTPTPPPVTTTDGVYTFDCTSGTCKVTFVKKP